MKILHLANSDINGGAAIAARRLHKAMQSKNIDSNMLVLRKNISDDSIISIVTDEKEILFNRFVIPHIEDKFYRDRNEEGAYSYFSLGSKHISEHLLVQNADIIYLHWINGSFISKNELCKILKLNKPVIWYMHDMFPITGGCYYSLECSNYKTNCKNCKYFKIKKCNTAYKQLEHKRQLSLFSNLYWIAPSQWLFECAKDSIAVNNKNLFCIPNIMSERFMPCDKIFARKLLGIDCRKKVIAFGANNTLKNMYKGFGLFIMVLSKLKEQSMISGNADMIEVLLFGAERNTEIQEKIPFNTYFTGNLQDEYSMCLVYNAADVYVTTSIAESFGLTVQESLACETPIAAFDVGGIRDMINYTHNGILIKNKDIADMGKAIENILFETAVFSKKKSIKGLCGENAVIDKHKELWNKIYQERLIGDGLL